MSGPKYTHDELAAIDPIDLTRGQRTAAIRYGIYPIGYFNSMPCPNCKTAPRHLNRTYCKICFDELFYEKYHTKKCPSCGEPKSNSGKQCKKCHFESHSGENHALWTGGRQVDSDGYVLIHAPTHPRLEGKTRRYVQEHVLVMESSIGRYLLPKETVHHKNGIKDDNRIENLELWASSHPYGQRVEDLVAWAKQLMEDYPEFF